MLSFKFEIVSSVSLYALSTENIYFVHEDISVIVYYTISWKTYFDAQSVIYMRKYRGISIKKDIIFDIQIVFTYMYGNI